MMGVQRHHKAKRAWARRGAAMVEFTLMLPTLLFIVIGVVYFGHSMVRKQHVFVASRQFAWHQADRLALPDDGAGNLDQNKVRVMHFDDEQVLVDAAGGGAGDLRRAPDGLVAKAMEYNEHRAGDLADKLVNGHFPPGQSMHVEATFAIHQIPMDGIGRELSESHFREGVPWQRRDTDHHDQVRDFYIDGFHHAMRTSADPEGLIDKIMNLYEKRW